MLKNNHLWYKISGSNTLCADTECKQEDFYIRFDNYSHPEGKLVWMPLHSDQKMTHKHTVQHLEDEQQWSQLKTEKNKNLKNKNKIWNKIILQTESKAVKPDTTARPRKVSSGRKILRNCISFFSPFTSIKVWATICSKVHII